MHLLRYAKMAVTMLHHMYLQQFTIKCKFISLLYN